MKIISSCYFVYFHLQFLLVCVVITNSYRQSHCFVDYHNGTFGKQTDGTVSVSEEDIYAFDYAENLNNDQVYFNIAVVIRLYIVQYNYFIIK